MAAKRKNHPTAPAKRLLRHPSGQADMFEKSYEEALEDEKVKGVECLGMTFPNDGERRKYFLEKLREKLQIPEFRKIEGFPIGSDEDILALSDPPYYTACPNPFVGAFVKHYGKPALEGDIFNRSPFAVDVSQGKTDPVYLAHSYLTKVPHLAIVPAILHYTDPDDLVLDVFCGSGMTGVAARWCDSSAEDYRRGVEADFEAKGLRRPKWGRRRVILNDLSPAATFIAANYNLPFDIAAFGEAAHRTIEEVEEELGWMYETLHSDGITKGRISFTVWSDVFVCPHCSGEVDFVSDAVHKESKKVLAEFPCPQCGANLSKRRLEPRRVAKYDALLGRTVQTRKRDPVLIEYTVGRKTYQKTLDAADISTLERIDRLAMPPEVPTCAFPFQDMWDAPRLKAKGISHVHQLFTPRALHVLAAVERRIGFDSESSLGLHVRSILHHQMVNASIRNTYRPASSFGNRALTSAYYVAAMAAEANVLSLMAGTVKRVLRAARSNRSTTLKPPTAAISTQSSTDLGGIPDASIDYAFLDPPFGDNFPYAELNLVAEAWQGVLTNATLEAIVDRTKTNKSAQKGLGDYQALMQSCFIECFRVLKPGRWMTVVFSNSRNSVWHAIQEALGAAGFVVADIRTLDKKQASFKQITSIAPRQDLVISCYKPDAPLEARFRLAGGAEDSAWHFVRAHLRQLPVFVSRDGQAEVIAERQAFMLCDRMVAFHVQRGVSVPLSTAEFYQGLAQRFPEREDMFFLPEQAAEYDKKRMTVKEVLQLTLFVVDESSAIQWLRQKLTKKPQTFQELHPQFLKETGGWQKHEEALELLDLLQQSFLRYEGQGEVPAPIHAYLSTNFKELRNLAKSDPALVAKARDRWYIPDPNKAGDLEKLRERTLLKEFEDYWASTQRKLKVFRLEAVRAGFKRAWQDRDYATIIAVAEKIPEDVLQEDAKLLMWYDQAVTRRGQ